MVTAPVVYEPLLKRLPADTPMYGFERVEGSVEERAAEYLPKLMELHDLTFVAFSPLAQGRLLDKFNPEHPPQFEPGDHRRDSRSFSADALAEL